jgi:hypothetical protein
MIPTLAAPLSHPTAEPGTNLCGNSNIIAEDFYGWDLLYLSINFQY